MEGGFSFVGDDANGSNWEVRSTGMVVQKRNTDPKPSGIRVRVQYGPSFHQIDVNPQACFGELKKLVAEMTGLHPDDQKLIFKKKERASKTFLDIAGVKEGSKILLTEDAIARERRLLQLRRTVKMEKASQAIRDISVAVENLGSQVEGLESVVSGGGKVPVMDVENLSDILMAQVVILEGIVGDGVKQQRRLLERKVQECIEALDLLKAKNSISSKSRFHMPASPPNQGKMQSRHLGSAYLAFNSVPARSAPISTTNQISKLNWETFE